MPVMVLEGSSVSVLFLLRFSFFLSSPRKGVGCLPSLDHGSN